MKRLFVSLYIAVTLGLFTIGWATEQLWQHLQSNNDQDIEAIVKLSKTLPVLISLQQPNTKKLSTEELNTEELSQLISLPVMLLRNDELTLNEHNTKLLASGEALTLYNQHNQLSLILQLSDQQGYIQVGPIPAEQSNQLLKVSLLFFSYLLLAAIIFLWTRPLWRDLNKLQYTAISYGKGELSATSDVNKRSVIWPLASTFHGMAKQIERLLNEQRQLTNAVSHDLRTPLARLKFSLAMDTESKQTEAMQQDVQELESLVDELLSYGRLESQHQKLNIDNVNLSELITHLTEKLARGIKGSTIELNLNSHVICQCDGHLIERAIQNLIVNAARYGNEHVLVSLTANEQHCIISVEDDGQGIALADRDKVFDAFTRLDKSRNKSKGGFGLGLAIVQRICQWHQGECTITEAPLGGAMFNLKLPTNQSHH